MKQKKRNPNNGPEKSPKGFTLKRDFLDTGTINKNAVAPLTTVYNEKPLFTSLKVKLSDEF